MNRRVVGVVALVAAVPLAVVASFLPLYEQVWQFSPDGRMDLTHTSWAVSTSSGGVFGREALYGVPVVVAAALLLVGAVFVRARWGRLVAFGGALMLVGAAWAVGQLAFGVRGAGQPAGEGLTIETELGSAVLVYGAACLVAVVGGVLVQDRAARVAPEGPVVYRVDEDDHTPPFGLALPPAPDAMVPRGYDSSGHDGSGSNGPGSGGLGSGGSGSGGLGSGGSGSGGLGSGGSGSGGLGSGGPGSGGLGSGGFGGER